MNHGSKRIRERAGINKASTERQKKLAWERGLHHNEMKGKVRKWVDSVVLSSPQGKRKKPVIYNNHLFLFIDLEVVTILPIPSNLQKFMKKSA